MTKEGSFADILTSPPGGWSGVIVLLAFGTMGNLVAGLITLSSGASAWQISLWILSLLVLLWGIYMVRRRSQPLVLVPRNQRPDKHRGLIVLVGPGRPGEDPMSQSAGIAIDYHASKGEGTGLQTCWLIASGGDGGSLPVAQALEDQCRQMNITPHIRTVSDAFDVQASYDLVERIYAHEIEAAGLSEREVISDFTGGVKPMSAGMILACREQRPMQYMYGRKAGIASVPRMVAFVPRGSSRA